MPPKEDIYSFYEAGACGATKRRNFSKESAMNTQRKTLALYYFRGDY
jgi:hypothetical protein